MKQMIGTGIFTSPFITLSYTRNLGLTMAYWVIGFLYTVLRYGQEIVLAFRVLSRIIVCGCIWSTLGNYLTLEASWSM